MRSDHTPFRRFRARVVMVLLTLLGVGSAGAWNQPTHKAVNHQAVEKFKVAFGGARKFTLGPVNFAEFYTGVGLIGARYFAATTTPDRRTLQLTAWVTEGGDWADEPQLYAAVRHFYDPLALSGVHYLTDQSTAHGRYDQPMVDAVTWALSAADNPFSWHEALVAYKRAMEIPEDGQTPGVIRGSHFKLDIALHPKDRAEEREIHLARAYRALGETMHLLADMVQPAHVRNDSHPRDEPVEDAVHAADVRALASAPVDARMVPDLRSAGGGARHRPEQLFLTLAEFTNRSFYSSDTVYDGPSGVNPRNQENPYPRPQFKHLLPRKVKVKKDGTDVAKATEEGTELDAWVAPFLGGTIPMATKGTYWHYVPPSFAKQQARVLIPIAIHAAADLMHQFYPTMELQGRFDDPELLVDNRDRKPLARHRVEVEATMVHHLDEDPAWNDEGLSISYAGPAELVFERGGRLRRTVPLAFQQGRLTQAHDHRGTMVDGPLSLYLRLGKGPALPRPEAHTALEDGDAVYVRVKAGSRTFSGPKLHYAFPVQRVEAVFQDLGLRPDEAAPGLGVRRIAVTADAVNRSFPARPDGQQLVPEYTGTMELAFIDERGRLNKTIPVWFEEGRLSRISDPQGNLVPEPLVLYGDESSRQKLTDWEELYQVEPEHTVSLVLWVDDRRLIRSNSWTYGVESEEVDGTYSGTLRLGGTEKLRDAIVTMFSYGFYPVALAICKATDRPPMSLAEVRSAVDNATTSHVVEVPLSMTVVSEGARRVTVDVTVTGDGGVDTRVTSTGSYHNGELRFKIRFPDGAELDMTGHLQGVRLTGTASGSAWGVVGDALEGSWSVRRE